MIIQEVHRLQKEADEANKSSSVLTRDNQRLEVQLADTAHQVRIICVHLSFYSQQFYLTYKPVCHPRFVFS